MRTPSLSPPCRAAHGGAYERQGRRGLLAAERAGDGRAGHEIPFTGVLLPFAR